MTCSDLWKVLDGLPAYGPMAEPFSATGQGTHCEGLVVRFNASTGEWTGNFQRGISSLDDIFEHPDGQHIVVVAGGMAYIVDVEGKRLVAHFGAGCIEHIINISGKDYVILSNGIRFEAMGPDGLLWRSRRISWDGMRNISLDETFICGEAYAPEGQNGAWYSFELDVITGNFSGGSYNGPAMEKSPMLTCPHCQTEVCLREIPHTGFFKDYRICPQCGGKFTPDSKTKHRQAICLIIVFFALVFTVLMYSKGASWLIPSLISYFALAALIYHGNKKIYLVPFGKTEQ